MAEAKKKLGFVACSHCGYSQVMVKENDAGTLSLACDMCGFSAFAKKGEKANDKIRQQLPAAAPEDSNLFSATRNVGNPAPVRTPFSLDQLK